MCGALSDAAGLWAGSPPQVVKSPTLAPAKTKTVPPPLRSSTAPSTHDAFDLHILDEYDPQDPNDYEALLDVRRVVASVLMRCLTLWYHRSGSERRSRLRTSAA